MIRAIRPHVPSGGVVPVRLLTNMPLTYLCDGTPVALTRKFYFGLTWGVGIEDDLIKVTHDFLEQTIRYWRLWVMHCSVPLFHQKEVIRSASHVGLIKALGVSPPWSDVL